MSQMKALYEKVAQDADLQKKFSEILADGEKAGKEATEEKLLAFAKDAGYSLSIAEMQEFFKALEKNQSGELSDLELDMVAGGKSQGGIGEIVGSVLGIGLLGIPCAISSIVREAIESGGCRAAYQ